MNTEFHFTRVPGMHIKTPILPFYMPHLRGINLLNHSVELRFRLSGMSVCCHYLPSINLRIHYLSQSYVYFSTFILVGHKGEVTPFRWLNYGSRLRVQVYQNSLVKLHLASKWLNFCFRTLSPEAHVPCLSSVVANAELRFCSFQDTFSNLQKKPGFWGGVKNVQQVLSSNVLFFCLQD